MLKTQIMTMFMMRPSTNQGTPDIFTLMYSMLLMNIVEYIFRSAPAIGVFATEALKKLRGRGAAPTTLLGSVVKKDKQEVNSISMTRIFNNKEGKNEKADNIFVEKVDAVLDYLCSLDNAKHIRLDTRYSLNNMDEVELTPMLRAKVKQMVGGDEENIIELMVYSSTLKVSEIRRWIDEIHEAYMAEKNNKLGSKIYYFNEVPAEPIMQQEMMPDGTQRKTYRWENMPKMLTFNMNEFKTSKSFTNVYGNHVDELKERLELFVDHPDWYMERGIPHSLGIMLHGVPGAGKTSTIKAIAKDTKRHIFNLSLRPYTTQRQLTNLFFNETVVVMGYDGNKMTYKIPLNKRVYVIEDIDCLTDVVMDRSVAKRDDIDRKEGESVTLSFLLNLLDGVLETPGRILIITSNYPEKLDRAFVRPGRIDVKIEFKNASREFIMDMVNRFYECDKSLEEFTAELENVFTPAEVMESLCMNFKDADAAIQHLKNKISLKQKMERERIEGTLIEDIPMYATTNANNTPEYKPVLPTKVDKYGNVFIEDAPRLVITSENAEEHQFADKITVPSVESANGADTAKANEILRNAPGEREFSFGGITWKCPHCMGGPSQSCLICNPKLDSVQKKVFGTMNAGLPMMGGNDGGDYANAFFEDTPFLDPSAAMPGQNPFQVRAAFDLNQMNLNT